MDCPGGSTEEVGEAVERVPLLSRDPRVGLSGFEHSVLGSLAQTRHPAEQNLNLRLERRSRESWQQALPCRVERGYTHTAGRGPWRASQTVLTTRRLQEARPPYIINIHQDICESPRDAHTLMVPHLVIDIVSRDGMALFSFVWAGKHGK